MIEFANYLTVTKSTNVHLQTDTMVIVKKH